MRCSIWRLSRYTSYTQSRCSNIFFKAWSSTSYLQSFLPWPSIGSPTLVWKWRSYRSTQFQYQKKKHPAATRSRRCIHQDYRWAKSTCRPYLTTSIDFEEHVEHNRLRYRIGIAENWSQDEMQHRRPDKFALSRFTGRFAEPCCNDRASNANWR